MKTPEKYAKSVQINITDTRMTSRLPVFYIINFEQISYIEQFEQFPFLTWNKQIKLWNNSN